MPTDLLSQIEAAAALGAKATKRPWDMDSDPPDTIENLVYLTAAANLPLAAIAEELRTARAAREAAERERDEARKHGAPVAGAKALGFVKRTCNHDEYWTTVSGACMACRAVKAEAECESLRAVVERLPKTADGVSVLEGDPVWGLEESPPEPFQASVMHWQRRKDGTWAFWAGYSHAARPIHSDNKRWYSTRAAAEAARLAGKGGSDAR